MRHPSLTRRGVVAVASLALASTAAIGGVAVASTDAEPVSTPVTISTPDDRLMSYVVNARIVGPGQTRLVETAVRAAGGVVVQSWPQIGVVIAHSKASAFRTDVVAMGGNAVESVGATRTVAVSEGTPEVAGASWGRGASGYMQGAKKAFNGDLESDATAGLTRVPDLTGVAVRPG